MSAWRDRLFTILHRNASDSTTAFGLPPDRTLDIVGHVDI
jgi:K+ transporter